MSEIIVFTTHDEPEAEMAAGFLADAHIPYRKRSGGPRNVLPLNVDGLGEIDLLVEEEDAERARELLAVRFSGPDETSGNTTT